MEQMYTAKQILIDSGFKSINDSVDFPKYDLIKGEHTVHIQLLPLMVDVLKIENENQEPVYRDNIEYTILEEYIENIVGERL